jgi:hypothetical protein
MTTGNTYYLIMVVAVFIGFGLTLAAVSLGSK